MIDRETTDSAIEKTTNGRHSELRSSVRVYGWCAVFWMVLMDAHAFFTKILSMTTFT